METIVKHDRLRVRITILGPLLLVLLGLTGVFVFSGYVENQREWHEIIERSTIATTQRIEAATESNIHSMQAAMHLIAANRDLRERFEARDFEGLLRLSRPLFEEFSDDTGYTHFYYHDTDRTNFMRVHRPEGSGGEIDRLSLDEAMSTGSFSARYETGKYGTYTLRCVLPWEVDGRLVGYLELGKEFVDIIDEHLEEDVVVLLSKGGLDEEKYRSAVGRSHQLDTWDQFASVLLLRSTLGELPDHVSAHLIHEDNDDPHCNQLFEEGGRMLQASTVPIHYGGHESGAWLMTISDVTDPVGAAHGRLINYALLILLITLGLGAGFYLFLGRVEGLLAKREAQLVEAQDKLMVKTQTDTLTGLLNRDGFDMALEECLARVGVEEGFEFAILFLDLDGFKLVNDNYGHKFGDKFLVHVSRLLTGCVRACERGANHRDVIARMGGDEFAILQYHAQGLAGSWAIADRVRKMFASPIRMGDCDIVTGASIGIRHCDGVDVDGETLVADSDIAMYNAKRQGRNQCVVFDDSMRKQTRARLILETELRSAIRRNEFRLYYQPIVSLESGELRGFEALIRWEHPTRGLLAPGAFIEIAEEAGLILEMGLWVMREACRQIHDWSARIPEARDLTVNVNLSKRQIISPAILDEVDDVLKETGAKASQIKLEVTESVIMHDVNQIVPILEELKKRGFQLAMDDFGTGYSSLASLRQFPLDDLKIDQSFIHAIEENREYAAIVNAIVSLAQNLNMRVVAEGLETFDQVVELQALDCDLGQGYYFDTPLTSAKAEAWITGARCTPPMRLAVSI